MTDELALRRYGLLRRVERDCRGLSASEKRHRITNTGREVLGISVPPEKWSALIDQDSESPDDVDRFSLAYLADLLQEAKNGAPEMCADTDFMGFSPEIVRIRSRLVTLVQTGASVFLIGERGTGKGQLVRSLGALIGETPLTVALASIPKELADSELFGHRKGAFTGAHTHRIGIVLEAKNDRRLLFLDDVGECSAALQAKLLTVLDDGVVRPVGSDDVVTLGRGANRQFRLVSSSQPASLGKLRRDFLDRIAMIHVWIPPLRDRGLDILLLADYFAELTVEGGVDNGSAVRRCAGASHEARLAGQRPATLQRGFACGSRGRTGECDRCGGHVAGVGRREPLDRSTRKREDVGGRFTQRRRSGFRTSPFPDDVRNERSAFSEGSGNRRRECEAGGVASGRGYQHGSSLAQNATTVAGCNVVRRTLPVQRLPQRCGDPELPTPDLGAKWSCFSGLGAFATGSVLRRHDSCCDHRGDLGASRVPGDSLSARRCSHVEARSITSLSPGCRVPRHDAARGSGCGSDGHHLSRYLLAELPSVDEETHGRPRLDTGASSRTLRAMYERELRWHGRRLLAAPRNWANVVPSITPIAAVFATLAVATCAPEPPAQPFLDLVPVAVSSVPEVGTHIALASEATACTNLLYHTRVYCVDRTGRVAGHFGSEGDGPGEFNSVTDLARGPDGTIGVFDWGLSRMTVFMPDGTLVSETNVPPLFTPARFFLSSVSGYSHTIPSPSELGDVSNVLSGKFITLHELDLKTGEVLWTRQDLEDLDGDGCYPIPGTPGPSGRWVFKWTCRGDLYFLDHGNAKKGRLVKSPTYVPEFPNDRDVADYLERMRFGGPLPPDLLQSYGDEYRAKPKNPFLGTRTLVFDGKDRLWYATTRDRDDFSYLDVWVETTYAGTVRIRDRLMAYDILGSTLVAFVERKPARDGIAAGAIDWYDIGDLEFPNPVSH